MTSGALGRVVAAPSPDTEEARRLLRDELFDPHYVRSWGTLFRQWVADRLAVPVGDGDLGSVLTPLFLVLVLVLAVAAVLLVLRARRRRTPPAPSSAAVFGDGRALSADDYRRRAEEHRRAGRHDESVIDRFRAIAASALERRILDDAPDLTAHEVGRALASAHPGRADRIRAADRLFAVVLYGGGHTDADGPATMADLDDTLQAEARSVVDRPDASRPVPEVPR